MNVKTPWYKSYKGLPEHLNYFDGSIYECLEDTISKYPNYIALNYFDTKITFEEMNKQIHKCAKSLKKIGVKEGDKITICMPNTPEAIYTFYAVNLIGGIANMIHPLSAESEIKFYLNISKSKIVLAINISVQKIQNIISETSVEKIIVVSPNNSMNPLLSMGYMVTSGRKIKFNKNSSIINYSDFIKLGNNFKEEYRINKSNNDPAAILYSGGTTGKPKGIVLSNYNFNALSKQGLTMCDCIDPGDKVLSIMPIFHGFGLGICIHTALTGGATAVILPQFSIKTFDKLLKKYKPNVIAGVPTLYEALLRNDNMNNVDLSCLKCAISGGDSLSINLKKKVDQFLSNHGANIQVREGYGLTECVTGSCLTPKNDYKEGSIGIPYPDTYYKIVKSDSHDEVPYGETGEICISGPTVMLGYLNEEKETAHTLQIHDDGLLWLHTGDLGSMDEEGFIYFKQRLKRMIITSGYNVYPQTLENIIDAHPDVLYSTVIGVNDEYKGQKVKAFIVLKNGVKASQQVQDNIYAYCEKNIAKYAMPKEIEYRDSLPKTLVGKVAFTKLIDEENAKN